MAFFFLELQHDKKIKGLEQIPRVESEFSRCSGLKRIKTLRFDLSPSNSNQFILELEFEEIPSVLPGILRS